jgi:hypothetical protein
VLEAILGSRLGAVIRIAWSDESAVRPLASGRLTWPIARLVFVGVAAIAVVLILVLARNLSFVGDEWAYIVDRRLTLESMLQPHNEHLAFLHVLVYRGLVETVGTGSYLPYQLVLMAVHVTAAAGVLALLSRYVSLEASLAAAVLFLFLGSGYDNLLAAFQMGFAGAVALGISAMVVVDRPWLSAALLTAALWTQGSGLFYVAPVALLIHARRWLLLPLITYGAWLLLIGRDAVPFPDVGPYLLFMATGLGSAVGGLVGVGFVPGFMIAGLITALLILDRPPSRFVVAGILGLAIELAILAIGRAQIGPEQAASSRYVYAAMPFIFMILTGVHRVPPLVWASLFAVALTLNIVLIPQGVAVHAAYLQYEQTLTPDQRAAPYR